jgi:quercetin dioxygenase-like cupin family protein/alkylhydroperoxidase/carboxymuconolactone decarboxylase family protein YurZ
MSIRKFFILIFAFCCLSFHLNAQNEMSNNQASTAKQQSIISISALTAKGDLSNLNTELNAGLDAGLTVNEIKEILVHLYAYCGFPRSLNAINTFMAVLEQRNAKGITDVLGREASHSTDHPDKYEQGRKTLELLTQTPQTGPAKGYGEFAPRIDFFLKEHLFADIFENDLLSYRQRELVTISALAAMPGLEAQLTSHIKVGKTTGITENELMELAGLIETHINRTQANVLKRLLSQPSNPVIEPDMKGELITNNNFTGTAWLQMLVSNDSIYNTSIGNVTFKPKARTNWHKHPGGQILLVTDGKGFYQKKGKPAQLIQKGDVVRIPPNTEHWHGAAPDKELTHIAISLNTDLGGAVWLGPVTDDEYYFK